MPTAERVLEQLAEVGYRETAARRAVVEHIAQQPASFTAQDVCLELEARGVGRATVFRTINLLVELNVLNRIHAARAHGGRGHGGDGCHRYTFCEPIHHHHLVCDDCGQVFPLEGCPVDREIAATARGFGFEVTGHHVEVFGRCRDCVGTG